MVLPDPKQGLVIRYAYLWHHEELTGHDEARYDRPCLVVSARNDEVRQAMRVYVLPVTHSPRAGDDTAIEMPSNVKRQLGLDDERSWIVTDQWNAFDWPGPDLREISQGPSRGQFAYGFVPAGLLRQTARQVRRNIQERRLKQVRRRDIDIATYRSTRVERDDER